MKKLMLVSLAMIAIGGCSSSPEIYTTEYLLDNTDKLDEILEQCKANEQSSENCENANKAKAIMFNKTGGKEVHQWQ